MRELLAEDFAGFLGMDILHHYVLQIDFDAGVVRLYSELPSTSEALGQPHELISQPANAPIVAAKCGSLVQNFLVDTGSTTIAVDQNSFAEFVRLGEIKTGTGHGVGTPTSEVKAKVGLMRNLNLGEFSHSNVLCDSDAFNVLGLRYLSRFFVTFDFPRNTVYLKAGKNILKVDPTGLSGLRPTRTPDGWTVTAVSPGGAAFQAGVQPGDAILDINGEPSSTMDIFRIGEVLTSAPGRQLNIRLRRDGREITAPVIIGNRFVIQQARR